jgi:hypothetical protein
VANAPGASEKRLNPRLRPAQNQGMHVMRPLIGVHHFQVHQVPCRPSAISVCMSASFFWISLLAASGMFLATNFRVWCLPPYDGGELRPQAG